MCRATSNDNCRASDFICALKSAHYCNLHVCTARSGRDTHTNTRFDFTWRAGDGCGCGLRNLCTNFSARMWKCTRAGSITSASFCKYDINLTARCAFAGWFFMAHSAAVCLQMIVSGSAALRSTLSASTPGSHRSGDVG